MEKIMQAYVFTWIMILLSFIPTFSSQAQLHKNKIDVIKEYRIQNQHKILKEYFAMLSLPNVSSDRNNIRKNAEFIKMMMEQRGIKTQIVETPGNPVIFGELFVPGASRTLMFYAHYDGQPVDTSKWTDSKPFKPVIRPGKLKPGTNFPKPFPSLNQDQPINESWRIYARSASDDKAPIMAMLFAIEAIQKSSIHLKHNIKFIFDGEEEAGSRNLPFFCKNYKDKLKGDVLFICDGPVYYSNDPTLFFGVRGITSLEIIVYGPNTSLHSGHFGNWAPNPALRLAQLLASMKDADGIVKIKGFYDTVKPLGDLELDAIKAIPNFDDHLKKMYGFSTVEGGGKSLMEAIQLPSLNIRGLQSGWLGKQARTIIPPTATASIDIRLVKGNDPTCMKQKIIDYIKSQGYHIVNKHPDQETRDQYPLIAKVTAGKGYRATRTAMDLPVSRQVIAALKKRHGQTLVLLPTLGGSLPLYVFEDLLKIPMIGVPIVNHDNNQHQPDENIRIGHLWKGIETLAALIMIGVENDD